MHPAAMLDTDELEAIVGPYFDAMARLGGVRQTARDDSETADPTFLLVATGGSEGVILEWWIRRREMSADAPLWLIAHPGNNSLPAALEVLARLQQDGTPGRIFYLQGPDDRKGLEEISNAAHDLDIRHRMQRTRIGLVGPPSDWLVASTPDAATVTKAWGPTVVPVAMDEVTTISENIAEDEVAHHVSRLVEGAGEVREPTPSDLHDAARLFLALERTAADHRLDALTVRCFDFVLDQRTTGCFALSQLTDTGVIAGCEGDLVSTIGLLWAHLLTDEKPWMANPAQLDPERNTLWLAHCTVPRSLVSGYCLRSHFESGLGVGIQGVLPPGPVTLLRIGGRDMDRVWLAEGEIRGSGNAENLCRTQAQVGLTRGGAVVDLLREPLGNHLVLVRGHHRERMQQWVTLASQGLGISSEPGGGGA
jgi:L-fucose isomerase-like protein